MIREEKIHHRGAETQREHREEIELWKRRGSVESEGLRALDEKCSRGGMKYES